MNISNPYLYITIILVFLINAFGYIYSYLIVTKKIGANNQIQPNANREVEYFKNHRPLFLLNVSILILFVFIGLHFFGDYIISFNSELTILNIILQLLIILIFDDTFFYFLHRLMHENKFIYKKIHKIHHRANSPIPIDYIYVHPLEWMSGFIGPFIGIIIIGGVSIYSFWLYLLVRNFHELSIHSGLKTSFVKFPFYGTNEHHDIHHARRDGNYASTFTLWDVLFKTKL